MDLKPGWLKRQFAAVKAEKATWPAWMKGENEMILEIKDCPECNQPALIKNIDDDYFIACSTSYCLKGPLKATLAEAAASWNRLAFNNETMTVVD